MVDEERVVFALLGGGPRDPRWKQDIADEAAKLTEETGRQIFGEDVFYGVYYGSRKHTKRKKNGQKSTPASEKPPRRGPFHSKSTGVSMGGGQETPSAFVHTALTALLMAQLFATKPFKRLAGFANSAFRALCFVVKNLLFLSDIQVVCARPP